MVEIPPERFAELVGEALDDIPEELGRLMENVAVVVDDISPPGGLFGLYEGIPLTERFDYGGLVLPDRITIFRRAICSACADEAEASDEVRVTVVHEVAHHFGIDDRRLEELGWA
ncbi:MAG: metallopeptidase family protein [Acidimicrobiales bacterium]